MLSTLLPISLGFLLATSLVSSAPTPRRSAPSSASASLVARQTQFLSNDPGCQALIQRCASIVVPCSSSGTVIADAWANPSCLLGASCYGGNTDAFLDLVVLVGTGLSVQVQSLNSPRVSPGAFYAISSNGKTVTQQDWINAWYGAIGSLGAGKDFPWPINSSLVANYYQSITSWAGVCNGGGVPAMNFGDYFEYSATVSSNACPQVTSIAPTAAPTPSPVIIAAAAPTAALTSYDYFLNSCVNDVASNMADIWSHKACILAAAAYQSKTSTTSAFVALVNTKKNGSGSSSSAARLTSDAFASISTYGNVISQQNWIDAWYGQLTALGASYPTTTAGAIAAYSAIANWTGACSSSGILYGNFADFFTYYSAPYGSVNGCPTP